MNKAIVALVLLAAAAPALADDSGFYLALDAQTWSLTNNTAGASNPSTGYRVGAGYRFTTNWAAEIAYAYASGGGGGGYGMAAGPNFDATSYQAAAVGTYPINEMFGIFAKLGAASNKLSGSAVSTLQALGYSGFSATSLMYGIGAQYSPNTQFGFRLQYENLGKMTKLNGGLSNLSASNISLGLVYYF